MAWSFRGRTRVYMENIGELSPIDRDGDSPPAIKGPGNGEVSPPKRREKGAADAKQP